MPAAPNVPEYPQVGTLVLGTRGSLECWDFTELLAVRKRGEDIIQEGQSGRQARDRVGDSVRGLIKVRVSGELSHDTGAASAPTLAARVEQCYANYALLKATADIDTTQTFTLHRPAGSPASVDCIVEDLAPRGRLNPYTWEYLLDVTLPNGPIAVVI